MAFLEAKGRVYTRYERRIIDYRLASAVRINKIEAHCQFCAEDNFLNIPIDKIKLPYRPLREGFAFEKYSGNQGILGAICGVEKHVKRRPWIKEVVRYRFQISKDGEFITNGL